jgi:CBF1 interacting corepressor
MVAGLAFLSKKGFNPANLKNQKTVWEARQQKEAEAKRIKERQDQLKRERDDEELARARDGQRGGDFAKLKFMYDAPPGTAGSNNNEKDDEEGDLESARKLPAAGGRGASNGASSAGPLAAERQPGDDDAAAAFRQMLAAASSNQQTDSTFNGTTGMNDATTGTNMAFSDSSGAALSGTSVEKANKTNEQLSALEKAVGRRDASSGLTLEEQIARFPQLKNAPMAKGMSATNVNVNFKPLGTQLRNTRCFVCGVWGHAKGDRECAMSGWDPFSLSNRPNLAAATAQKNEGVGGEETARTTRDEEDDDRKRSARDYNSSDSSDDSEDSRRKRRKRHRKKHKSRKHDSKRRRRSHSPDERRRKKSSHKHRKKRSRHDDV